MTFQRAIFIVPFLLTLKKWKEIMIAFPRLCQIKKGVVELGG
jgi:hypothetical protein